MNGTRRMHQQAGTAQEMLESAFILLLIAIVVIMAVIQVSEQCQPSRATNPSIRTTSASGV